MLAALGEVDSVVNVGLEAGTSEPPQTALAVEPRRVMIDQRRPASAPVAQAVAEAIPLPNKSVDAALAVLTVHHSSDVAAGVAEMRRVARRRVVFFTGWREQIRRFWLLAEYFRPGRGARSGGRLAVPVRQLHRLLGEDATVRSVPVPLDCLDGFAAAYWRRPDEFGHLQFGDPGARCPCGALGCWTVAFDIPQVARRAGLRVRQDPRRSLHRLFTDSRPLPHARRAREALAADLGRGIAGLVNALDPDVVTLGGLAPELRAAPRPASSALCTPAS
jgi:SAM-dependent methyltransferase